MAGTSQRGQVSQVEMLKLMLLHVHSLDAILIVFLKEPADDLLLALVERQLRKVTQVTALWTVQTRKLHFSDNLGGRVWRSDHRRDFTK